MLGRSVLSVCAFLALGITVSFAGDYQFLQLGQDSNKAEDGTTTAVSKGFLLGPSKFSLCEGRVKINVNFQDPEIAVMCRPGEIDGAIDPKNAASVLAFPSVRISADWIFIDRAFWQLDASSGDLRLCVRVDHFPRPDAYKCVQAKEGEFPVQ